MADVVALYPSILLGRGMAALLWFDQTSGAVGTGASGPSAGAPERTRACDSDLDAGSGRGPPAGAAGPASLKFRVCPRGRGRRAIIITTAGHHGDCDGESWQL